MTLRYALPAALVVAQHLCKATRTPVLAWSNSATTSSDYYNNDLGSILVDAYSGTHKWLVRQPAVTVAFEIDSLSALEASEWLSSFSRSLPSGTFRPLFDQIAGAESSLIASSSTWYTPSKSLAAASNKLPSVNIVYSQSHHLDSRQALKEQIDADNSDSSVYVVPLRRATIEEDVAFAVELLQLASRGGRTYMALLGAAAAATVEQHHVSHGEQRQYRNLLASPYAPPQIYANPNIVEGLLIGFFMLFMAIIGLNCVAGVASPDVMHSTTMPAGKEY